MNGGGGGEDMKEHKMDAMLNHANNKTLQTQQSSVSKFDI